MTKKITKKQIIRELKKIPKDLKKITKETEEMKQRFGLPPYDKKDKWTDNKFAKKIKEENKKALKFNMKATPIVGSTTDSVTFSGAIKKIVKEENKKKRLVKDIPFKNGRRQWKELDLPDSEQGVKDYHKWNEPAKGTPFKVWLSSETMTEDEVTTARVFLLIGVFLGFVTAIILFNSAIINLMN